MTKKILLVEDDNSLAQLYKTAFEVEGYRVEISDDGEEGLKKAASGNFDLIILDIVLPNVSGLEILKKLKAEETTKDLRVVMLTNYGQQENISEAYDAGAADVFLKYRMTPTEATGKIKQILG